MGLTAGQQILRATARAAFWQSFEAFPSILAGLAQRVDSDSDQETYPWLAYAPGVREMAGSRLKRPVPEISWTIKNKKWENTVPINYETYRFNKIGAVQAMLSNLGAKARAYPDKLVSSLIDTGNATLGYDAVNFFATTHKDPGAAYTTNQSNSISVDVTSNGAPATITDVEFANGVRTARNALFGFKDGDGDPVMMDPNTVMVVMVPADYASIAERVQTVDQLTGPVGNDLKGKFTVRINPWLTLAATTPAFYVFNASGVRKPFIYQVADEIRLEDDLGEQNEFDTKDVSFGSFGFYNVGYGDWRYGVRILFT